LLSFSPAEQRKAEVYFDSIKNNVRRNWKEENHRRSIIISPNAHKSGAMALFAFRNAVKSERDKRMENVAVQAI